MSTRGRRVLPWSRGARLTLALSGLLLVALLLFTFKSFTPPILARGAVADLSWLEVNGDRQSLLIRGHDRDLPILLFLHGGPGMPAMYLAHAFQRKLERHFVVVHWDQRASGKSYKGPVEPERLRMSQLLSDTEMVVRHLQSELGVARIFLVGHSHGSILGTLYARHRPQDLEMFVGVGQSVADPERAQALQNAFLRERLQGLGLAPDTEITAANREDLLFRTRSELHDAESFIPLLTTGLRSTEYSLFDALNVAKGSSFSSRHLVDDVIGGSLIERHTHFEVPVAMVMGERDMVTPVALAREYFELIEAPDKHWFEIEEAAHFPFFEQPERFTELMVELRDRARTSPDRR